MAYSYFLYLIPTDQVYYGIRTANKKSPEDDFWKPGGYYTSSRVVKELRNKYGDDAFIPHIRVKDKPIEYLSKLEVRVLRKFDVPNNERWLNRAIYTGKASIVSQSAEARAIRAHKRSHDFVIYKEGVEIRGRNLAKFARTNNVDATGLRSVLSGKTLYYKGYTATANEPIVRRRYSHKSYQFYGPDGKIVNICNLKKFCEENNLSYTAMSKVAKGSMKNHKGYRTDPDVPSSSSNAKRYTILKDGVPVEIENIRQYCMNNTLNLGSMWSVATGRGVRYYKGYTTYTP